MPLLEALLWSGLERSDKNKDNLFRDAASNVSSCSTWQLKNWSTGSDAQASWQGNRWVIYFCRFAPNRYRPSPTQRLFLRSLQRARRVVGLALSALTILSKVEGSRECFLLIWKLVSGLALPSLCVSSCPLWLKVFQSRVFLRASAVNSGLYLIRDHPRQSAV